MALFYKQNSDPQELPFEDADSNGRMWTDLANNQEGQAACGWTQAPDKPQVDPNAKTVTWDRNAKQWVTADIPPQPPAPPPTEYYVNKYYFLSRFTSAEKIGFNRTRKKAEGLTDTDYDAANANPQSQQALLAAFEAFLLTYDSLENINLLDPTVKQALGLFAALGIITQDRIEPLTSIEGIPSV